MIPSGLEASIALLRHGESVFITEGRFQGQIESPLSPLGERQAQLAGARLAQPHRAPALPLPNRPPIEIVHSPLMRTTQTAHFVADAIGGDGLTDVDDAPPDNGDGRATAARAAARALLRPEADVMEIGQGEWEGLRREEVEAGWPEVLRAWRERPTEAQAPGGERLRDVQLRVGTVLDRLLGRLADAGGDAPPGSTRRTSIATAGYPGMLPPDSQWSILVGHDGVFKVLLLTLFDLPLERFWSFPFALCGITIVEIRAGRPILRAHNVTEHLAPLLEERAQAVTEERQKSGQL